MSSGNSDWHHPTERRPYRDPGAVVPLIPRCLNVCSLGFRLHRFGLSTKSFPPLLISGTWLLSDPQRKPFSQIYAGFALLGRQLRGFHCVIWGCSYCAWRKWVWLKSYMVSGNKFFCFVIKVLKTGHCKMFSLHVFNILHEPRNWLLPLRFIIQNEQFSHTYLQKNTPFMLHM